MPELVVTGGQLDLACEYKVLRAIDKVMHWLGWTAQARRQLWQRIDQWLPVHGGNEGGMRAFRDAYLLLGENWGVRV